VQGPTVIISK